MRKTRKRKVLGPRMRRYLSTLVISATVVFILLFLNIIRINIAKGKEYEEAVFAMQNYSSTTIPYKRGDILDANGTVLATSRKVYALILEPKFILEKPEYIAATKAALKKYFNISEERLNECLSDSESLYKRVKTGIQYADVRSFKEFRNTDEGDDVVGCWFEESYERYYPYNEVACHVLGYTVEDNVLVGYGGLEGEYNRVLDGENGRSYAYMDANNDLTRVTEAPTDGNTLVTSLDIEVQKIVQQNVEEYNKELKAKNISVLVMNPNTGEILALYNSHQYDCNNPYDFSAARYQYPKLTDEEFNNFKKTVSDEERITALNKLWRNFVVSDAFEPGSTYKTFTISGALDEGVVKPSDTFFCGGSLMVDGWDYPIFCHNHEGHGTVDVGTALAYSCNVTLMQIAAMEGSKTFDKYQHIFGFGQYTEIDLQGEESAIIHEGDNIGPIDLATSSFGQGVTTTMIQIGTAFCSVINGGYYYQPHLVKQVLDSNGNVVKNYDSILVRRTISEQTSAEMRKMLEGVVEDGTGWRVKQDGYRIGGKTGTAEKFKEGTNERDDGKYILSFIGFAPVDNPQVVVYVTVNEPGDGMADYSPASTETFKRITEDLFPYLNIYKAGSGNSDSEESSTEADTSSSTESSDTGSSDTGSTDTESTEETESSSDTESQEEETESETESQDESSEETEDESE